MRRSELQDRMSGEEIVKCACGLPMRKKNWADHWLTCHIGSEMDVTEEDRDMVLASEGRAFLRDQEHREWLRNRDEQISARKMDLFGRAIA